MQPFLNPRDDEKHPKVKFPTCRAPAESIALSQNLPFRQPSPAVFREKQPRLSGDLVWAFTEGTHPLAAPAGTMSSGNHWGGPFELVAADNEAARPELDETQKSWLLKTQRKEKDDYVDLGCVVCNKKVLRWTFYVAAISFLVIALPVIISKSLPKRKPPVIPPDKFSVALHKALLFFDAQKCERRNPFF